MKIKWLNLSNCVKDGFNNKKNFSDIHFYTPHVLQYADTLKQTVLGLSSIEVPAAKIKGVRS